MVGVNVRAVAGLAGLDATPSKVVIKEPLDAESANIKQHLIQSNYKIQEQHQKINFNISG